MTDSGLRQRAMTAALLIVFSVSVVVWLPTPLFALAFSMFVVIGAWEWANLVGLTTTAGRVGYQALLASGMLAIWLIAGEAGRVWLLILVALWWWSLAMVLSRIRVIVAREGIAWWHLAAGIPVLLGAWVAFVHLHGLDPHGPMLVLFLLVLVGIADSAAYFSGRRWGKAKLAPILSPAKTWAGVYGALIGALLWGLVLAWAVGLPGPQVLVALVLCGVSVAMSIVGDLYESLLKRRSGLKDSGRLLPGHGGMLDRIDGFTAAAPIFALGVIFLVGIGS